MKRKITSLLTVLLALAVSLNVTAQVRKTWDFTKLSQETIDNLIADTQNWESEGQNDDGTHKGFKSKGKLSGELQANGVVIPELAHLTFGTSGLKGGDYILRPTQFRMTRAGMVINFPKLAPGQTLTIRARSANNSATDRGFVSNNDNLEYISGPKGGTCIGRDAEGYGNADYPVEEDGNYTLVWKVREDLGTDSLDISIKTSPNGGLDIALFMIDEGDEVIEKTPEIAYLYDSSKANYSVNDDVVSEILSSVGNVLTVDIKDFKGDEVDTIAALEANYDLIVVSETPGSGHAWKNVLKGMVNRVPMMNLKSFFYKNWGWGAGSNPKPGNGTVVLTEAAVAHPIFAELGYEAGAEVALYDAPEDYTGNIVQGYTVNAGTLVADDEVLATVSGINAIHVHGTTNAYMLFPLSSDAVVAGAYPTEECMSIWSSAINYLVSTKSKVRPASKPTINVEYANGLTTVEIVTGIEGATIYYTLDGTEPTTASSVYTEALNLTTATTVKAYIVAQGYNDSDVASAEVVVKTQAAQPVITVTDGENGTKIITMTGDSIHYNLCDVAPTTASPVYTEPIVVSRSTQVSAIGVGTDMLDSETATAVIEIEAFPFRLKELATVTFVEAEGFVHKYVDESTGEEKSITIANKTYMWGIKKAWSYYYANGDSAEVNTLTRTADFGNGWVAESKGQVMHMHNDGSNTVGAGYGPATTADADFVKGGIQFLGKASGDPYSATLFTNGENKFQGPFDVAVWMNGATKNVGDEPTKNELLEVSTSVDGITWTVVDTLSIPNVKAVRRVVAHYDGTDNVYVKFAHAGGDKCMLQQIQFLGVGVPDQIEAPVAGTDAELIGVQIYNAAGVQLNAVGKGLNIIRKIYANGAVEVLKVMGE